MGACWDLDQYWRTGTDLNFASDQNLLAPLRLFRAPTWLTANELLERLDANSYFPANSYYFQTQRADVVSSTVPIIAPLLNYTYTTQPDRISAAIGTSKATAWLLLRPTGTDSNRISSTIGWNLPYTAAYGGVFTFRADIRGDGYYVTDVTRPRHDDIFSGTVGRFAPEVSLEWEHAVCQRRARLPSGADAHRHGLGGEPHRILIQNIPNEDSLDFEFDDTNLFGQDRFSGLDRVETGARVNYGLQWSTFNQAIGSIDALLGQSYRFYADPSFTPLSGLAGHLSDYVGHIDFTPSPYVSVQYRFRLDKDSLATRRAEVTTALGPDLFRFSASYIFVKADGELPITERRQYRGALRIAIQPRLTALDGIRQHPPEPWAKRRQSPYRRRIHL